MSIFTHQRIYPQGPRGEMGPNEQIFAQTAAHSGWGANGYQSVGLWPFGMSNEAATTLRHQTNRTALQDYLNFHESACVPLDRGLYLGYVKLHSTMNQISIVVPENLPSVLPFVYIRENSHVSK